MNALSLIAEYESKNPPANNATRTYSVVRPLPGGEVCFEVWAARRNRKGVLMAKAVDRYYSNRNKFQTRDQYEMWWSIGPKVGIDFSETGYGRSKFKENGWEKGKWGWRAHEFGDKYIIPAGPLLNGFDGTKYQYCAYSYHGTGMNFLDYIELYRIDPRVELLVKGGVRWLLRPSFVKRFHEDNAFVKWISRNAGNIRANGWDAGQCVSMYLHGLDANGYRQWRNENHKRYVAGAAHREELRIARAENAERERYARLNGKIKRLYDTVKDLCGKLDAYEVVVPKNSGEMVTEGNAMCNCVGKCYPSKVASRECVVVFLHKNGKPFVDISIDLKTFKVTQCLAKCNRTTGAELHKVANRIACKLKRIYREAA